jgi:DinB superfamily
VPLLTELARLYTRDLKKVMAQLEAYADEAAVWAVAGDIRNSAGTLALHLVGNLSQFIGTDLGGVPFVRDRDSEFSRRDVPRAELKTELLRVQELVETTLTRLPPSVLDRPHPRQLSGFPDGMTSGEFVLHLYGHLNWHLGQIDYHRRLTAGR